MNRLIRLIFIIEITITTGLYSQVIISGRIQNQKQQAIEHISVVARNAATKSIVSYAFSNKDGFYKLTSNPDLDSIKITASGLNNVAKTVLIRNITQELNFTMADKELKLKEVTVREQKVRLNKDTVNYLVSAFTDKKDLVIGDVLKKMPGIMVDKDGGILWQGKPINTFYIENLDLLRGRYNIATNNVAAEDVATVQVLQHHQPVKALDSIVPSETAAINLKLKEGAKGKINFMVKAGLGGLPVMWENELAGMYFAKLFQNITTYKCNNTGNDLSGEIKNFGESMRFDGENLTNVRMPSTPGIDSKRYLFNNSQLVTVNNILKLDSIRTANVNVSYLNNRDTRKSSAITSYYIPGNSPLIVSEDIGSQTTTNRVDAGLQYNQNGARKYFENSLNFSGKWNDIRGDVVTDQSVHQSLQNSAISLIDNLDFTNKLTARKGFNLHSSIGFQSTPQQLSITPGVYNTLFNNGQSYDMLIQNTRTNNLNIRNSLTLLSALYAGDFSINPDLLLSAEYRHLTSGLSMMKGLQNISLSADSLQNNLHWLQANAVLGLPFIYNTTDWYITLRIPVYYRVLFVNDKHGGNQKQDNRCYVNPSFSAKYHLNSNLDISGYYSYKNSAGDGMAYCQGYILSDYRNLSRNNGQIYESTSHNVDLEMQYTNLLKLLSINTTLGYSSDKSNLLYGQTFQGGFAIANPVSYANTSDGYAANVYLSKGFNWKKLKFELNSRFQTSQATLLQEDEIIAYKSRELYNKGALHISPFGFLNLEYNEQWHVYQTLRTFETMVYQSLTEDLVADFLLPHDFIISAKAEHYYNSASAFNKNLAFFDVGLTYIWKKIHFSLDCNNLFDTNSYATYYYDAINSYQNSYHIRERYFLLKVQLHIK